MAKKLDKVLVNDAWPVQFSSAYAIFGEPDFSDHASCGVVLSLPSQTAKKPFKFSYFLLQNNEFLSLISYHWYSYNVVGSTMFRLSRKLKMLKKVIRKFNKENYFNLEKIVEETHAALMILQSQTLVDPSEANAGHELEGQRRWQILAKAEESFFCQRSRVTWYKEGDMCTAYFHQMAASRKVINHIHFLLAPDGSKKET